MPDETPFLPISYLEAVLPLDDLGLPLRGTILDYVGVEDFDVYLDQESESLVIEMSERGLGPGSRLLRR